MPTVVLDNLGLGSVQRGKNSHISRTRKVGGERMAEDAAPENLTIDEAYRAAFYMVLQYLEISSPPAPDIELLAIYMWTDPARWDDWTNAVRRALSDGGLANADHEGRGRGRPGFPYHPN